MSNKQKTAMQEFLRFMGISDDDPHVKPFLEKERQQIVDSFCSTNTSKGMKTFSSVLKEEGEQYYNETYGSDDAHTKVE